jgi:uncharacterized ferritin-like protein (DUF455 family)
MPTPIYTTAANFEARQSVLYSKAAKGQKVFIDTEFGLLVLSKKEEGLEVTPALAAKIAKSKDDIRAGRVTICETHEDVVKHLNSL